MSFFPIWLFLLFQPFCDFQMLEQFLFLVYSLLSLFKLDYFYSQLKMSGLFLESLIFFIFVYLPLFSVAHSRCQVLNGISMFFSPNPLKIRLSTAYYNFSGLSTLSTLKGTVLQPFQLCFLEMLVTGCCE